MICERASIDPLVALQAIDDLLAAAMADGLKSTLADTQALAESLTATAERDA